MSFLECPKQWTGRRSRAKCWPVEPEDEIDSPSWGDILADDSPDPDMIRDEDTWEAFDDYFTKTPEEASEDEIVTLYDQLATINAERIQNPADDKLTVHADNILLRLRFLQKQEASRLRSRFERSLTMPIDAGHSLLEEVRSVLMKHEDPATDSSSS
jgi:hypothetical protein